jgi:hypothetical protein
MVLRPLLGEQILLVSLPPIFADYSIVYYFTRRPVIIGGRERRFQNHIHPSICRCERRPEIFFFFAQN